MAANVQLTNQQILQKNKINAYIESLEDSIVPGANEVRLDENLHETLADLFKAFDLNANDSFNSNETQKLISHLKDLNTDSKIATMFDSNGSLLFNTGGLDIDGNQETETANDFVALDNILSSKAAEEFEESFNTSKTSRIILANGKQIKHGLGNDAVVFSSKGGYHIVTDTNKGGHQTKIYDASGKMITKVSGDPHVSEGSSTANRGWDWHFGDDSTFILDDGTEILFNTEHWGKNKKSERENIYITTGLYIISDNNVYQTGKDISDEGKRNADITKLDISAIEFDATVKDAKLEENGADTFVYSQKANDGKGGWSVLTDTGTFEDVAFESWSDYRKADLNKQTFDDQTVDTGTLVNDSINLEQKEAALDGNAVRIFDKFEKAGATAEQKEAFFDYYFEGKASDAMLTAFSNLIQNDANQNQLNLLDDYIQNKDNIRDFFTPEQEAKYFTYIAEDEEIAEIYLELIKNDENQEKLELFEEASSGANALDPNQIKIMMDFADKNMVLAETFLEISQEEYSVENKIHLFENYVEKTDDINTEKLYKFMDALSEADEKELDLLERLVSNENENMRLLEVSVDLINNPYGNSIRTEESSMTNLLSEFAIGNGDLLKDVLEYQNSNLNTDDREERRIVTQNADTLAALAEAEKVREIYKDYLNDESMEHLTSVFSSLSNSNSQDLQDLSDVLEVFHTSMINGNVRPQREEFYKNLFDGLLNIDVAEGSNEDFRESVADSVFLSIQFGKENARRSGIQYSDIEALVSPYSSLVESQDIKKEIITLSAEAPSVLESLRSHNDYELIGIISTAFSKGNQDFIAGFNEIIEESGEDLDKIAKEARDLLVNSYEYMLEVEFAKPNPSYSLIRTWRRNIANLQDIAK